MTTTRRGDTYTQTVYLINLETSTGSHFDRRCYKKLLKSKSRIYVFQKLPKTAEEECFFPHLTAYISVAAGSNISLRFLFIYNWQSSSCMSSWPSRWTPCQSSWPTIGFTGTLFQWSTFQESLQKDYLSCPTCFFMMTCFFRWVVSQQSVQFQAKIWCNTCSPFDYHSCNE